MELHLPRWNFILLALVMMWACKHEPQLEPLRPVNDDDGGGVEECDPTVVYFQQEILPILTSTCTNTGIGLNCHHTANDNNDWIQLTDYQSLMNSGIIANGDLWDAINEDDPDKVMPRPPQSPLTPEQIALIGQWIAQGAQNNSCASAGCDTLNVTYSGTIVPLVNQKCRSCHSGPAPGGNLNFTTYAALRTVALDGRLEASIKRLPTGIPMPPAASGALDFCSVRKFMLWIGDGAPDN